MTEYSGNIGSVSLKETVVLAGQGPHIILNEDLAAGLAEIPRGAVVSLDAAEQIVPFEVDQVYQIGTGDAAAVDFSGSLSVDGLVPGSVSVTDGVETFTDDGFGNLAGSAGGSGKVNYQTGTIAVAFNTAPATDQPVTVTYKPAMHGVLTQKAETDAVMASVCVFGKVNRQRLTVNGAAVTAAHVRALYAKQIWPLG